MRASRQPRGGQPTSGPAFGQKRAFDRGLPLLMAIYA
jgi:hypothetical protein